MLFLCTELNWKNNYTTFKFMKISWKSVCFSSLWLDPIQPRVSLLISSLLTCLEEPEPLKKSLSSEVWGIKGIQYIKFICFPCYQVPCFTPVRINIFLSLPFVTDVIAGALLVALDILDQIQFHLGFSFPIFIPGFLDIVSVFTEGARCPLFIPCWHPRSSAWLSLCWDASLMSSPPGGGNPLILTSFFGLIISWSLQLRLSSALPLSTSIVCYWWA